MDQGGKNIFRIGELGVKDISSAAPDFAIGLLFLLAWVNPQDGGHLPLYLLTVIVT